MGNSARKEGNYYWKEHEYCEEQQNGLNLIEEIVDKYRSYLKTDYVMYRNHCWRIFTYTLFMMKRPHDPKVEIKKLAVAIAFHDIGIWIDLPEYEDASRREMRDYLQQNQLEDWMVEIDLLIEHHYQVFQKGLPEDSIIEIFRKAHLTDFSWGIYSKNLPLEVFHQTVKKYPLAGYHYRMYEFNLLGFVDFCDIIAQLLE